MPSLRLCVTVATQTMEVWKGDELLKTYPVSTSRFGLGTEEGSFKTPLGSFEICEKHGGEKPLHTIFKERKPAGKWNPDQTRERKTSSSPASSAFTDWRTTTPIPTNATSISRAQTMRTELALPPPTVVSA